MMDLISVIVPIYKVEPYLDRCVQSIVSQTYERLEIILVDDGSPDNCGAMCDAWAEKDGRIKVVHKENGGLSDARNAGLEIATGALISFIDSDDAVEPTFLEELHQTLVEHEADVAECDIVFVDEDGKVLRQRGTAEVPVMDKMEALGRLVLEAGIYQTVWNKLYRRSAMEGIPFEKGKYNEDDFWTYQVFDRIGKLAVVDRPLYNYLQRSGSIMGTAYSLKRLDGLEARFLRMEYLQKYGELAALTRQQLQLDCLYHYQCALRGLQGQEKKTALTTIRKLMKSIPKVGRDELTLNGKYRIWLTMFKTMPALTARVRNLLKIGL